MGVDGSSKKQPSKITHVIDNTLVGSFTWSYMIFDSHDSSHMQSQVYIVLVKTYQRHICPPSTYDNGCHLNTDK